jgi:GT2 family glycosyltransferase
MDIKKISIIIPSIGDYYKNLKNCLESIIKYTCITESYEIEIICVINGANDRCLDELQKLSKLTDCIDIKLIYFKEPIGYPKAINSGIKLANGEYIILLNDDTQILESEVNLWIDYLVDTIDAGNHIAGPLIKYEQEINTYFVIFFCAIIKKEVFTKIGLLDEAFGKGYCEDIDFCIRARKHNFNIAVAPINEKVTYNGTINTGMFPIYHSSSGTFNDIPEKEELYNNNFNFLKTKHNL